MQNDGDHNPPITHPIPNHSIGPWRGWCRVHDNPKWNFLHFLSLELQSIGQDQDSTQYVRETQSKQNEIHQIHHCPIGKHDVFDQLSRPWRFCVVDIDFYLFVKYQEAECLERKKLYTKFHCRPGHSRRSSPSSSKPESRSGTLYTLFLSSFLGRSVVAPILLLLLRLNGWPSL